MAVMRTDELDTRLAIPLLLSTIAGSATALGGAVVYLVADSPSDATVSGVLAFAAGVMTCVSIVDLWLPHAVAGTREALWATLFAGIGAASCRLLSLIRIPEPEELFVAAVGSKRSDNVIGGALPAGSDGAVLPGGGAGRPPRGRAAWRLGALLALVLTLHNLPEGIAVGVGAVKSKELGMQLMTAIFCHNVAEGFVIAIPVLAGTGNRRFSLVLTALSGLSEPAGAVFGVLLLRFVSPGVVGAVIDALLCGVAGVMVAVSLQELLPQARRLGSLRHVAAGFAAGAAVIFMTLYFI